jgi:hypothetical protein
MKSTERSKGSRAYPPGEALRALTTPKPLSMRRSNCVVVDERCR